MYPVSRKSCSVWSTRKSITIPNKAARPQDARFTDRFLVVTPGITIRDRLRVLLPSDPSNYYREMNLVPPELREHLGRARIVITNFHAFQMRSKAKLTKRSYDVPFEGLTSDVWALGNYAYLGSFSSPVCSFDITGTRIIDISDPTDPSLASFIPDALGTRTNDVKAFTLDTKRFSGDVLITTNEGCGVALPRLNSDVRAARPIRGQGGINFYDVSDPNNPHALRKNFLRNGIYNTYVWEDGDKAYLIAVDDVAARDVIIVDITNPSSPKVVTTTGAPD